MGLVGCVKKKRNVTSRAKDLYRSDLFMKARGYAEKQYDKWFIISARYHLVEPQAHIEPYDETLNDKTAEERRQWSRRVFEQIKRKLPDPSSHVLYFHAGYRYRQYLISLLTKVGYRCEVPLEGLGIGKQLAWYKRRLG